MFEYNISQLGIGENPLHKPLDHDTDDGIRRHIEFHGELVNARPEWTLRSGRALRGNFDRHPVFRPEGGRTVTAIADGFDAS